MRTCLLALLIAGTASAAPVPKELKEDDLSRFEGLWWEVRFNDAVAPNAGAARRFSFGKDGKAGIHSGAGAKPHPYTFALDPSTIPPSFTWKGPTAREDYRAIYRLDGDNLHIVFVEAAKPLPQEVKAGAGDVYYELKRLK